MALHETSVRELAGPAEPAAVRRETVPTGSERVSAYLEGGVAWVVLDNAAKRNALTADMFPALTTVLVRLDTNPAVRVVVVRGAGDQAFSAGADLGQLQRGELTAPEPGGEGDPLLAALRIRKPVIAMIHGYCLGWGFELALGTDIRICSEDAVFGVPAARLGVAYTHAATTRLVALVGTGHAAEILYRGNRLDAEEAARIGLVNRVVAKAALEPVVRSLAAEIAGNAPLSHEAHKGSIRAAVDRPPRDPQVVSAAIRAAWDSRDFSEARRALRERRAPVFTGH